MISRPSMTLIGGGATDVGRVRKVNEDSYLLAPGMVAVADGMGGHRAGDVASRITIEACKTVATGEPLPIDSVERIVATANSLVRAHAAEHDSDGMGSTLVGAVLVDNGGEESLLIFNVGDSRCYAIVDGGPLAQLTVDHSVVQEMIDSGEITAAEGRHHAHRNVVTRAIGIEVSVAADFVVAPKGERVRLLFCSDGVSGELGDSDLERLLGGPGTPEEIAQTMIAAVLNGPAKDNATAVVLDVLQPRMPAIHGNDDSQDDATGPRRPTSSKFVVPGSQSATPRTRAQPTSRMLIDEVPL
jgi:PPM family protein phosphatase